MNDSSNEDNSSFKIAVITDQIEIIDYGEEYTELEAEIVRLKDEDDKGTVANHGRIIFRMLQSFGSGLITINGFKALLKEVNVEGLRFQDENGDTALHKAANKGYSECIKEMLRVSSREVVNKKLWTPLHAAACRGDVESIKVLLQDSRLEYREIKDLKGQTALHQSVFEGNVKCIRELLKDSRAEYRELRDDAGWTALHIACTDEDRFDCVEELLKDSRSKYREIMTNDDWTPLHTAATNGILESVELLLEDARPSYYFMSNNFGHNATQSAYCHEEGEVLDVLLNYKYIKKILSIASNNIFATNGENYSMFWSNDIPVRDTLVWLIGDEYFDLE
eukprot:TRINITY_DN31954_c1_g1_i1.p1 TRINITY_DN31954_c1_g1~~TRINITY_DN31954_c1_g1_i1.p1  ORF type:complete len:336 (-),score=67.44 TRINITY_DN31954_c1_g1_i1:204-1211(-)